MLHNNEKKKQIWTGKVKFLVGIRGCTKQIGYNVMSNKQWRADIDICNINDRLTWTMNSSFMMNINWDGGNMKPEWTHKG